MRTFCLSHGYPYSSPEFRKRAYQIPIVHINIKYTEVLRHTEILKQISNRRNRQRIKTKLNEETAIDCCFKTPPFHSGNDFKSAKYSRLLESVAMQLPLEQLIIRQRLQIQHTICCSRDVQNTVFSENQTLGQLVRSGPTQIWVYFSRERQRIM